MKDWLISVGGIAAGIPVAIASETQPIVSTPVLHHIFGGAAGALTLAGILYGPVMKLVRSVREDIALTAQVLTNQKDTKEKLEAQGSFKDIVDKLRLDLADGTGRMKVFFEELRRDFDGLGGKMRKMETDITGIRDHQRATDERLEALERDDSEPKP